jgi:hypothetical protein
MYNLKLRCVCETVAAVETLSMTYSEREREREGIRMCVRGHVWFQLSNMYSACIMLSWPVCTLSHKWHNFWKKVTECKMFVLIFSSMFT